MDWHFSDGDVTVVLDFLVDGNFVVPESASYSLRGDDYAVLDSNASVTLVAGATSMIIAVTEANNGIGADDYQFRYIQFSFVSDGKTYGGNYAYGLTPWLPVWVTAADVRARLSLSTDELPDGDVDLLGAHIDLVKELGTDYTDAAGSEEDLNRALMLKAAIASSKSIMLRARLLDEADDFIARRFNLQVDFNALQNSLQADLAEALAALTGAPAAVPTILVVTLPTDAITGA